MVNRTKITSLTVTAVIGLVMYFGGWALSSPIGSSADETRHLTSIWCGNTDGTEFCKRTSGQTLNVRIPKLVAEGLRCMEGRLDNAANCQDQISDVAVTEVEYPGYDNYPGLFYDVLRPLVGEDVVSSVLLIRLANAMLFVALFALVMLTSKAMQNVSSTAIISVLWAPVSFLIPSANPSSWSITGALFLPIAVVTALEANSRKDRNSTIASIFTMLISFMLIAGSRYDALLATPFIFVLAVGYWKFRFDRSQKLALRLKLLICASGIASFWLLYAVFRYLRVFDDPVEGPPRHHQTVLAHNLAEFPNYVLGFVGSDPWNVSAQQGMRVPVFTQLSSLTVILLVVIVAWRSHSLVSRRIFVLGLSVMTIVILALHQSAMFYAPKLIQPRYFMPLLIGVLVGFIISSKNQLPHRALRWCLLLTFLGQSLALYQNFRRYVIGLRETGNDDLGCMACSMQDIGWWWVHLEVPPVTVWAIAVTGFGVTLSAIYSAQVSRTAEDMHK